MNFAGKVGLVTGAGSGIGLATARKLVELGATVAVIGHDQESAENAVRELGGGEAALPFGVELSDPEAVQALFADIAGAWGRLDFVVANAGINGVWAPLDELTPQEWERTIAVNLTGTFLTLHHAVPLLRKAGGGGVVITSSVNGTRVFSNSGASAYSSSKAGQVALAKMAAVELARDSIRVNVVCPGSIETEIEDSTEKRHTEQLARRVEYPEGQIPLTGEVPGSSEQVADLIAFLLSDAASHITGTEVWIDGGQSLLVG